MSMLDIELKTVIEAIEKARRAGNEAALAVLAEQKQHLCALLAALDPVM